MNNAIASDSSRCGSFKNRQNCEGGAHKTQPAVVLSLSDAAVQRSQRRGRLPTWG